MYLSTNSLKAAVEAGKTITQALGEAFDRMSTGQDRISAQEIALYWNDPNVRAQLAACGQHGAADFRLFDWLITPAYADDDGSCPVSLPNGHRVVMTRDGAKTLIFLTTKVATLMRFPTCYRIYLGSQNPHI
ncbi:hypothetical protein ASC97_30435 [Rhizobium sp. Root1203]|nr:hypothetical protein ASC97_30435 [Rhizobium sp. Root1203]